MISLMNESLIRLRRCIGFALCCISITALYSQTADVSSFPPSTFRSKVHVVVVDVTVADRNGVPVTGLKKDDFDIYEGGKLQTMASFEEHKGVPARSAEQPPFAVPLAPNFYTNYPLNKPADSVNVLLLDALNTPLGDQANVRKQIVSYLNDLKPGPRLAIFTLGSRIRMVEGFTADPAILLAAINNKKFGGGLHPSAMLLSDEQSNLDQQMLNNMTGAHASDEAIAAMRDFLNNSEGFQDDLRIENTLDALQQLARYLGGFSGRKNLIWFAGSFPAIDLRHLDNDPRLLAMKEKIQRTTNMLAAAQVALYPISAQGLELDTLYSAADPYIPDEAGGTQGSPVRTQNRRMAEDRDTRILNHTGMDDLARDTGGKAFYNTNGLSEAMNDVIAKGTRYYTISYAPTDKRTDGKYRSIRVRLRKGHYKLSYRRGYFAESNKELKKEEKRAEDQVPHDTLLPMMARGAPEATQILYQVHVQPSESRPSGESTIAGDNAKFKGPAIRYGVDFNIYAKDLDLETGPGGTRQGSLEISMVAYDHDGNLLNWIARRIELAYSAQRYIAIQESGIPFHLEMDAPEGDVYLRTGVYQESMNKAGTLEISLKDVIPPSKTVWIGARPEQKSQAATRKEPAQEKSEKSNSPAEMNDERGLQAKAVPAPFENADLPSRIEPSSPTPNLPELKTDAQIASYCEHMAASQEHSAALVNVCEFAISIQKRLPDVICDRQMKRHWWAAPNWIKSSARQDVVTSKVVYRNGLEYYEDLRVNGKPADPGSRKWVGATWSSGEFATILGAIFLPQSVAEFHFEKEGAFHSVEALVFQFNVEKQNNKKFYLHAATTNGASWTWYPAYHGRIWLDAKTFQLLRLERVSSNTPGYPIKRADTEIDYADVALGDGSHFVLPTGSDVLTCLTGDKQDECAHNIIQFTNWHKFGVKTQILVGATQ
jgi:VWFA-related protein